MGRKDKEILIDQLLDAALKEYGVTEPRPGLEGRILANLRAEGSHAAPRTWLRRPVLLAVATMLLTGITAFLKTRDTNRPLATGNHLAVPAVKEGTRAPQNQSRVLSASRAHYRGKSVVASAPRLEQFPSPQPLSKQEELLARYIEQFPREAVLMARAQTELLQREMIEPDAPPEKVVAQDSQEQNP